jgi:hypothetical protein
LQEREQESQSASALFVKKKWTKLQNNK